MDRTANTKRVRASIKLEGLENCLECDDAEFKAELAYLRGILSGGTFHTAVFDVAMAKNRPIATVLFWHSPNSKQAPT